MILRFPLSGNFHLVFRREERCQLAKTGCLHFDQPIPAIGFERLNVEAKMVAPGVRNVLDSVSQISLDHEAPSRASQDNPRRPLRPLPVPNGPTSALRQGAPPVSTMASPGNGTGRHARRGRPPGGGQIPTVGKGILGPAAPIPPRTSGNAKRPGGRRYRKWT